MQKRGPVRPYSVRAVRLAISAAILMLVQPMYGCRDRQAHCRPYEAIIPVDGGGTMLKSATIVRDPGGGLHVSWSTDLPDGTKAMFTIGRYDPKPADDIPFGPILSQAGLDAVRTSNNVVSGPAAGFSVNGKPYEGGSYYADLTSIDNEVWEQPQATRIALLQNLGKLPKVLRKDKFGHITLTATVRFELPPCE